MECNSDTIGHCSVSGLRMPCKYQESREPNKEIQKQGRHGLEKIGFARIYSPAVMGGASAEYKQATSKRIAAVLQH